MREYNESHSDQRMTYEVRAEVKNNSKLGGLARAIAVAGVVTLGGALINGPPLNLNSAEASYRGEITSEVIGGESNVQEARHRGRRYRRGRGGWRRGRSSRRRWGRGRSRRPVYRGRRFSRSRGGCASYRRR